MCASTPGAGKGRYNRGQIEKPALPSLPYTKIIAMAKADLFADMPAHEYRDILQRLGLNDSDAARLMGRDPKMSRLYAAGKYPVPPLVAVALRLIDQHVPADQLARFKRPRGRPPSD
jgi:hypothetical protein